MTDFQRQQAYQLARQLRPLTPLSYGDRFAENIADIGYGVQRALSGYTLGATNWLGKQTGLGINDNDYLAMKQYNGGELGANLAGLGAEIGGNILGGGGQIYKRMANTGLKGLKLAAASGALEGTAYGASSSYNWKDLPLNVVGGGLLGAFTSSLIYGVTRPLLYANNALSNQTMRWLGKQNLINQLKHGPDFEDINLGRIAKDKLDDINNIRLDKGMPLMTNRNVSIPANVIDKWQQKRIIKDHISPKTLATSIDNMLYENKVQITPTKELQNQALIYPKKHIADMLFVSVNPSNPNQNVIKSFYRKKNNNVEKTLFGHKSQFGRTPTPFIDNLNKSRLGSHGRLTDHQTGNSKLTPTNRNVNSLLPNGYVDDYLKSQPLPNYMTKYMTSLGVVGAKDVWDDF